MRLRIDARDIAAGLMFIGFAAFMLWLNQDHPIGTANRMGSGYMPMLTFGILGVLGVAVLIGGFLGPPAAIPRFAWRDASLILAALLVFALTVERLGFVVSLILCIGVASLAEKKWKPLRVAGLAAFLVAFCWMIFIWYLEIRIPVFPWSY